MARIFYCPKHGRITEEEWSDLEFEAGMIQAETDMAQSAGLPKLTVSIDARLNCGDCRQWAAGTTYKQREDSEPIGGSVAYQFK